MAISYKPLWKLWTDRNMKKKDLIALSGVSQYSISKMGRSGDVNTDILDRIYIVMNCNIADMVEVFPGGNEECPSILEQSDCKT